MCSRRRRSSSGTGTANPRYLTSYASRWKLNLNFYILFRVVIRARSRPSDIVPTSSCVKKVARFRRTDQTAVIVLIQFNFLPVHVTRFSRILHKLFLYRDITSSAHAPMSLAAGPGRGGGGSAQLPDELELVTEKHVAYIQSLDTVCFGRLKTYPRS